ncbi:unnamed protein product [Ectocarpus sp. 12 AP-2014]
MNDVFPLKETLASNTLTAPPREAFPWVIVISEMSSLAPRSTMNSCVASRPSAIAPDPLPVMLSDVPSVTWIVSATKISPTHSTAKLPFGHARIEVARVPASWVLLMLEGTASTLQL